MFWLPYYVKARPSTVRWNPIVVWSRWQKTSCYWNIKVYILLCAAWKWPHKLKYSLIWFRRPLVAASQSTLFHNDTSVDTSGHLSAPILIPGTSSFGEFEEVTGGCRSQWPRGLRCRSAAARLLRLWVRIPPVAWIFVSCECCVLSGRGISDELIIRPEESCRLWCVVVCDLKTSWMKILWPTGELSRKKETNKLTNCWLQKRAH